MALLKKLLGRKPRAVVVGIDGLPYTLLKRFCDEGVTPNIAELSKSGRLAQMKVSLPEISAVSWPSFMTGANPGVHGIYGFTYLKPGGYEMGFSNYSDCKAPAIWDKLGEEGKRSIVINQPGTYPARAIQGVMVSGFVAIDIVKAVRPPSWIGRIKRLNYQIDVDTQRCRKDHKFLFQELERTLEGRKRAVEALWEEDWSYFQVVVTGTDRLQHYLWEAVEDDRHEYHRKAMDYYRAVDEFAGWMREKYIELTGESGPGKNFYMLSDHGFCGIRQEVYLNSLLQEKGLLKFNNDDPRGIEDISDDSAAFAMDPGRVYLHYKDKYPRGSVSSGRKEELIEQISELLLGLVYEGEMTIASVKRAEDIYSGPELKNAPDIVATPVDGFDLKASVSGEGVFRRTDLTGMHTWNDAFFWSAHERAENLEITQLADIIIRPLV